MQNRLSEDNDKVRFSPVMKICLGAVLLVLLTGGIWFYRSQEQDMRIKVADNLATIAEFKVNRITDWRRERLADASVLTDNSLLSREVSRYMSGKGNTDRIDSDLLAFFNSLKIHYKYTNILLTDREGDILLSSSKNSDDYDRFLSVLPSVTGADKPVFTDLHVSKGDKSPHIALIAPITADSPGNGRFSAAVVMVSNASRFLYPMLRSWPTQSRSAETMLIRREDDHVLFLNNLRHRSNTALKMMQPLTADNLLAVRALEKQQGLIEGLDYRGSKVLAEVRPVPGTPWFLVAKIDQGEALAHWYFRSMTIVVTLGGMTAFIGVVTLLLRQRRQKYYYQARFKLENDLRTGLERQSAILKSIGDAVIATDRNGRVELMNRVAERLSGWTEDEAMARPLDDVFSIINEESGLKAENPVNLVLRKGVTVGLANHTLLIARDGTQRPIADSGSPVYDEQGTVSGVVLVFQDQSREREQQKEAEMYRQRLDTLMSNLPGMAYRCSNDRSWTMEFVSEGCLELTGYRPGELVYDTVVSYSEIVHPNHRDLVWHRVQEALQENSHFQIEYPIVTRGGAVKWVWEQGRGVFAGDGKQLVLEGFITDITERKQAEEAVRNHHRELEQIFAAMPEAMIFADVSRRIVRVNTAFEEIFGYTKDEAAGRETRIIYAHEEDYDKQGEKRYNPSVRENYEIVEIEYRRKNGAVFVGETVGSPICDSNDRAIGLLGLIRDVTPRKRREEALKQREAEFQRLSNEFRTLLDAIPDSLTLQDKNMKILWANQAAAEEAGRTPDEMIGRQCHEIRHNSTDRCSPCPVLPSFADGERHGRTLTTPGGNTWDLRSVPLLGENGEVISVIEVGRNITEHRRLEDQLLQAQKMESVGRLAGGVAHDYNNMLNVILGYSSLALDNMEPAEPIYSYLKEIQDAARRSSEITRQLLAFARKQTASPEVLDLNNAVESMLKILGKLLGEDIDIAWAPGLSIWPVQVDPTQVDQILANLCVNARDAISGTGKITIETANKIFDKNYCDDHPGSVPGEFVMLAVSDNGCGMNKEIRDNAFEPFYTTKDKAQGTGLGLSTVYGIVKQNAGFINIYSELGEGTTIRIYFPRSAPQTTTEKKEQVVEIPGSQGETILLVEDELSILNLGRAMLESLGYEVLTASMPKEGLDIADQHAGRIHLLITDVIMPELNGRDLARKVADKRPGIQIIFMSGYTDDVILHHGVLEEGAHFIQKPFDKKDMALKIREVLSG